MSTRVMGEELTKRNEKILEAIKELGPISSADLADYIGCSRFVIIDSVRNMRKGDMGVGIMSSRDKGYWYDDTKTSFKNYEGYNDPTFKFAMDNLASTMMSNGIKAKSQLSAVTRTDKVIFEEGRIIRTDRPLLSFKTFVIAAVSENGKVLKAVPIVDSRTFVFKDGTRKIAVSCIYTALPQKVTEIDTRSTDVFNAALSEENIVKVSKHVLDSIKSAIIEMNKPKVVLAVPPATKDNIVVKDNKVAITPEQINPVKEEKTFSEMEMELALAKQRADIYEKILLMLIGGKV